jgi:DNA-binding transcriptional MocR family regulator
MPKAQAPDTWKARVWAEWNADNLTRAWRDVLLNLAAYRGTGGMCCPSHETLAERAGCCVRTVQRALQAGRDLGLVDWRHRQLRRLGRCLRTSNSYRLTVPADAVVSVPRPIWRPKPSTGLNAGGGETKILKEAYKAAFEEAARLPDLLAARRAAFAAKQMAALAG